MLINGSNTAQVYRNGNSVLIEADGFQVISNVLDKIEKFPNSKIFTGMTFDFTLTFDRSTLLPILNRAMIFTVADLSNAVVVSFKKGQLEISSYNAKDGAGSQEIIECGYDGNDISFLVDGKDFIDELTGLPTDSFELHFDGEKSEEEYKGLVKIKQGKVYYMLSILDVTDKGDA
jgi:DNA polymerase III sliding clamp (beta) subunit (PCNA family)